MKTATLGQIRKVLELLEGVSQQQVQDVLESGLLSGLLSANVEEVNREEFRKMCGYAVPYPIKVVVDYTKTLAEMISAGKYDWVNENITQERFPVSGNKKEERELVLFHFNRVISSENAIAEMEKAGFVPCDILDLLALGASQPELQRQFPIIALGSVWRDSGGHRRVPYLFRHDAKRYLDLDYFEHDWDECYRFLARRK